MKFETLDAEPPDTSTYASVDLTDDYDLAAVKLIGLLEDRCSKICVCITKSKEMEGIYDLYGGDAYDLRFYQQAGYWQFMLLDLKPGPQK